MSDNGIKRNLWFWALCAALVAGLALLVAACNAPASKEAGEAPEYTPTATIQDLMLSMVDPSADMIWDSVATVATIDGIEERRPKTEEDWQNVHINAVRLVEATNLLLMERKVAAADVKSENPGIELEPHQIQALIDQDKETWDELVHGLYDAAKVMYDAIEERDADKLFDNGGALDEACENCHRHYWYPEDMPESETAPPPVEVFEPTSTAAASAPAVEGGGTIEGHVRLDGKPPGNRVVRMGMDPKCTELWAGEPAIEEVVLADADGNLANVLVGLEGPFPPAPVPSEPVVVDQQRCFFEPRVVGVRAGQELEFHDSDPLGHNVASPSSTSNAFDFSQPAAGSVNKVQIKPPGSTSGELLQVECKVHRWMKAYVGVFDHPYFAVTPGTGAFTLQGVPPGEYTITAWHESFGKLQQKVKVEEGKTAKVDFSYKSDAG